MFGCHGSEETLFNCSHAPPDPTYCGKDIAVSCSKGYHIHTHAHMHARTLARTHTHTHNTNNTYTHTTHTHTHTHTHAHAHTLSHTFTSLNHIMLDTPNHIILSGLDPFCEEGSVRLTGGASNITGRLEVCEYGRWGSVCSHAFDDKDALVACKQLGFHSMDAFTERYTKFM